MKVHNEYLLTENYIKFSVYIMYFPGWQQNIELCIPSLSYTSYPSGYHSSAIKIATIGPIDE